MQERSTRPLQSPQYRLVLVLDGADADTNTHQSLIRAQEDVMRTTAQPNAQKRLETIHNLDNAAMRSVALHTRRTGDEQPNPR